MIIFALLLCTFALYMQRRHRGKLVASDLAISAVYIGLVTVLAIFASPALTRAVFNMLAVIGLIGIYLWHRNEVHSGRREPVWFGKHRT